MGLSVSANAGNGLANLFRQARPAKLSDENATSTEATTTAVSLRPLGRSGIDSTGSGTAQISAALTVYLSKLGGPDDAGTPSDAPAKAAAPASLRPSSVPASRSSAADLMRVLDAYGTGDQRLTA